MFAFINRMCTLDPTLEHGKSQSVQVPVSESVHRKSLHLFLDQLHIRSTVQVANDLQI